MPHSKCVFCRGRSFAFKGNMHSVEVKRPSATDQRRYKAAISGSVEAKLLFSIKMIKFLRQNHNRVPGEPGQRQAEVRRTSGERQAKVRPTSAPPLSPTPAEPPRRTPEQSLC